MTRLEYELLLDRHPELQLPEWWMLDEATQSKLSRISVDTLLALRMYSILSEPHLKFEERNLRSGGSTLVDDP